MTETSHFVHSVRHQSLRFHPSALVGGATADSHFRRLLPLRPARFVVGLQDSQVEEIPDAAGAIRSPANLAFYLGRVEEVSAEGEITATVWERPSGRESIATLSTVEHLAGQPARPGDLLRIWTWEELPGDGEVDQRIYVTIEARTLDHTERKNLARFLADDEKLDQ